jgi:hypothetical protein
MMAKKQKNMNDKMCDMCGSFKPLVRDTLIRMCEQCSKDFEEGNDCSDLLTILNRRGAVWIKSILDFEEKKNGKKND